VKLIFYPIIALAVALPMVLSIAQWVAQAGR